MPLPKRLVEPIFVARSVYLREDLQEPTELEAVTNTTLTNIIRQLSSLSKHSEDLFGELARDAGHLADRANSLQARIDRLSIKVTQLDSTVEEISLQDIQLKKAFKSSSVFDQQIFSRATMPAPMLETYQLCDKPPPLDKLNCYRDDGKDGLKFYTDPNYFFELWRQEMLKDTERVMHDRGKKMHRPRTDNQGGGGSGGGGNGGGSGNNNISGGQRHKKRVRPPHNTRERQIQLAIGHGETLMPNNIIYRTPNAVDEQIYNNGIGIYDSRPNRPNSIELRRSYPQEMPDGYGPPSPQYHQNNLQSAYDEGIYNSTQQIYNHGQGPLSSESLYAPGTPRGNKPRPSVPPPAPPSSGSGGGTPNVSNANTPTRGRSMSTGRDNLPPPPPIPEGMQSPPLLPINGGVAAKILARSQSTSRAGSPQLNLSGQQQQQQHQQQHQHQQQPDQNAFIMQQLNNQINNLNLINNEMTVMNSLNDLPPPPPIPEQFQMLPKSQQIIAPPPPPPPPLPLSDGPMSPPKLIGNGDLINGMGGVPVNKISPPKKILPAVVDSRTDLMKAIRDGIILRKVEKSEAKEIERTTNLHDVASILARRVAIELSESESSESDEDSEGWMEPNETSA